MLDVAFKEWASICRALSSGRQSLILRKGGIAERDGVFRPEHAQFWLYPTFLHQQEQGTKAAHLEEKPAHPQPGTIELQHFVVVDSVRFVDQLDAVLRLNDLHAWTEATVRQRFAYRSPGLYVMGVRVYGLPSPHCIVEEPAFAGCKTWVELSRGLPTEGAVPVLTDAQAAEQARGISERLGQ